MFGINFLNALSFEIKVAIILAILAFIASFIASFFSGAVFSIIMIRLIVSIIIFAIIGYGIGYVITKYVPEITVLFQKKSEEEASDTVVVGDNAGLGESEEGMELAGDEAGGDESFSEMKTDDLPHLSGSGFDLSEGRLGKHILNTEEAMQYEPKLMAQAVRTMMTKDE